METDNDTEDGSLACDDDAELIEASRSGDRACFGKLYQRHAQTAYRFACKLLGSVQGADDLVSEAFTKVLERIASGGGPSRNFVPYLLTTVRTTWYKQLAGERMIDRQIEVSDAVLPAVSGYLVDDQLDVDLAARAFASLPDRWRKALWHLEIENESTAAVADALGIQANAVAALAFRARDGLRIAYAQMHIKVATDEGCRETTANLAAWLCGRLKNRTRARIGHHLRICDRCADCAREVSELLAQIRRAVPLTVSLPAPDQLAAGACPPRNFGDLVVGEDLLADKPDHGGDHLQANLPVRA